MNKKEKKCMYSDYYIEKIESDKLFRYRIYKRKRILFFWTNYKLILEFVELKTIGKI